MIVWKKSSRSGPWTDNCVEVGVDGDSVLVRDTKHPESGTQRYSRDEWLAFIDGAKLGEFDI